LPGAGQNHLQQLEYKHITKAQDDHHQKSGTDMDSVPYCGGKSN